MGVFAHSPRLMATLPRAPDQAFDCAKARPQRRPPQPGCEAQFVSRRTRASGPGSSLNGASRQHLFPLLPPELRLRVWSLNLPSCRLVPLRCGTPSPSLHESPTRGWPCATGCTTDAPIPVNLHVCAESRREALKTYGRAFGFARGPVHVVFSPDSDILWFGPRDGYMAASAQFHTCMSMCDQAELARVRRVAISDSLFWVDGTYASMTAARLTMGVIMELATRAPALERIIFVSRAEDEGDRLPAAMELMSRQIQMALAAICQQLPLWRLPPWQIVSTSALSAMGG